MCIIDSEEWIKLDWDDVGNIIIGLFKRVAGSVQNVHLLATKLVS